MRSKFTLKKTILWALIIILGVFLYKRNNQELPVVAIASYGPHASLSSAISGIKEELKDQGLLDKVDLEISDVAFDSSIIRQMLTNLKSKNPKVFVTLTTPVSQAAKELLPKDVPVVFCCVTDPVKAGLLENDHECSNNITGSAERQDLSMFLKFAKQLLPNAKKVGMLYSSSESNDTALVQMMRDACEKEGMIIVTMPVESPQDVPLRVKSIVSEGVDFIYVGASGPIQPTIPAIAANASNIPIFNVEEDAVQKGIATASFGVRYKSVGRNAGKIVAKILKGEKQVSPIYPKESDHFGCINSKKAKEQGIEVPSTLTNVAIID